MIRLIAAIVASTFAFSSVSGFAATAAQREDLTQEQRKEMRTRADRLKAERAAAPTPANVQVEPVNKDKKPDVKKHKGAKHTVKKSNSKA